MHCFSSRVTSWLTWTLRVGGFVLRRRIGASVIRPSHLGWPTQQQRRSQEAVAVLRAKNRWGRYFISFLPAISPKAATAIRQTIRGWRMASTRNNQRLEDLARLANPVVRGWLNS